MCAAHGADGRSAPLDGAVALVADERGTVVMCSPAAAAVLECTPGEPFAPLSGLLAGRDDAGPSTGRLTVRTRAARTETLDCTVVRLAARSTPAHGADRYWLVLVPPVRRLADPAVPSAGPGLRSELARTATASIGISLNVVEGAEALADLLVPEYADLATVDLAESVLLGDEPPRLASGGDVRLRRVASAQGREISAERLLRVGEALPPVPDNALMRPLMAGKPVAVSDVGLIGTALGAEPEMLRGFIPEGAHASVAVPLYARGLVLGCLTVWRTDLPAAFDDDDVVTLEEIASRAALGLDNARRYLREQRTVVTLQRSLLPRSVSHLAAAETAGVYQPAAEGAGVGGDWFDVIPLPSLRVAFVVGDVVGHGLHATAAMARLRTAVRTLADLDLEPGELLAHLDDLVLGLSDSPDAPDSRSGSAVLGATCLYAVYDPVTRSLTTAAAGHLPPAVLQPGREPALLDLVPGPPLGVGGLPFTETVTEIRPGAVLAFFTDGLVGRRGGDIETGTAELLRLLGAGARDDRNLDEITQGAVAELLPGPSADDAALLLARVVDVPPENVAEWEIEADLALVAHARELVVGQLEAWQLDELAFVTELVVSELVTNAIRYAGGPVGLRLIRDRVLVCEVSDPGSTQPRLRRARDTDEGGRGLFLVAQLTDRWGSRFTRSGKTIWTEQAIGAADAPR